MGYIVLSRKQVEGGLNVKLCKDKAWREEIILWFCSRWVSHVTIDAYA